MSDNVLSHSELLKVLELFAFDNCNELFWRCDDEYAPLMISVLCNDVFAWGTADCEEITPADLPMLAQAFADAREATGDRWESGGNLYCARKRKERPQGAYYRYIPDPLKPLFDAAGPERSTGLLNPLKPVGSQQRTGAPKE